MNPTEQTEYKYGAIRELQEAHTTASFTVGAEGGNVINVAILLKTGKAGTDCAQRRSCLAYLSGDANGDSILAAAPNGGIAIGTDGLLLPVPQSLSNALLVDGNLAIDAVPEKFKTTQTLAAILNGVSLTKAATGVLTFSAAHKVTATLFGCVLFQINAAGTISTKVAAATQSYASAPLALAALPSADAGNIAIGYVAIQAGVADWTANTDDMTNGSDLATASFTDASETALSAVPKIFQLVSESDGDIDLNITETGIKDMWLVLVLEGHLHVSGKIAFT